jgi:hypothetical protein
MKTKFDLNAYGVKEMNSTEMKELNGGCWCPEIKLLIGTLYPCASDKWVWFWEVM